MKSILEVYTLVNTLGRTRPSYSDPQSNSYLAQPKVLMTEPGIFIGTSAVLLRRPDFRSVESEHRGAGVQRSTTDDHCVIRNSKLLAIWWPSNYRPTPALRTAAMAE